jgi:REP-associated tyrosine transposase
MMERAGKKNGNNADFQVWQQNNHPLEINSLDMAWQKLEYIHNNPVKAGIVEKPEDYLYSSARDYNSLKGMLDIILLAPMIETL